MADTVDKDLNSCPLLTRIPIAVEDNIAYLYVMGTTQFCVKAAIILVVNVFNRIYISSMSNLS